MHTALVGIFGQSWWVFGAGATAIVGLFLINYFDARKKSEAEIEFSSFLAPMIFAFVAYVPWAASLPETPFLQLTDHATQIAAGAAIVLSYFIERIALLFGVEV